MNLATAFHANYTRERGGVGSLLLVGGICICLLISIIYFFMLMRKVRIAYWHGNRLTICLYLPETEEKTMAKLKDKQTSIARVQDKYRMAAIFPLIFHCSLPLHEILQLSAECPYRVNICAEDTSVCHALIIYRPPRETTLQNYCQGIISIKQYTAGVLAIVNFLGN